MKLRSLKRGVLGGAFLAWGAPVLIASCSSASTNVASDAGVTQDAQVADVTVPDTSTGGEGGSDVDASCPLPKNLGLACDGSNPNVVFFPPLACDPKALDAGSDANDAGDAGSEGGTPCGPVTSSDVSFTSAACTAFVNAQTAGTVSFETSGRTPVWSEPLNGDALTADEWSIFAWTKGAQARVSPLVRLTLPEAHALTPLAGDGYVVVFAQGCTEVFRAMVTSPFWTPDPTSWATLSSLQGPVTIRVFWAKFDKDGITAGPVASAPITITMKH